MAYNLRNRSIRQVLVEEDENVQCFGGEASDIEEDHVLEESEGSEYEQPSENDEDEMEVDENEDDNLENACMASRLLASKARGRPTSLYRGKNGYVWTKTPTSRTSDRFQNVQHTVPGPINEASNLQTIEEFWDILVNEEIINIIVKHTNDKIEDYSADLIAQGQEMQSYHHHTDVCEIRAFIGIFYYCGLWKSSNVDDIMLWGKKNGITLYRCVMSLNRFRLLSVCLRFDKKSERDPSDKFAHVRKIWDIFIGNCNRYYQPHKYCTVDKQLLSFRGRCSFSLKSKPDKYGLKIVTLNDAYTSYLIYGIPYVGKANISNTNETIPDRVFREVTTPIHGTNCTVTCDKWFTTIPLIEKMMEPPFNLTITGTIRKNKREIPAEMKVASKTPPATKFCFSKKKDITLLSFTPKKHEFVLVASSFIRSTIITNDKPDIIWHYNATKDGTDTFDQLCRAHTVSRRTNRWPMRIFFGILDQAIVNARILLQCKMINSNQERIFKSSECLEKIYIHLITPFLLERQTCPTIRSDIKLGIAAILSDDQESQASSQRIYLEKRKRCMICRRNVDRKTKEVCPSCERPMCDEHRAFICIDCAGQE